MDSDEASILFEVERLARVHLAASSDETSENATSSNAVSPQEDDDLLISPGLISSILDKENESSPEQTALVSVPASTPLPDNFLFRLEAPLGTSGKVEEALNLQPGTVKKIAAERTGEVGEKGEKVDFVFITKEGMESIKAWIADKKVEMQPLFVTIART